MLQTKEQIEQWLNSMGVENYKVEDDLRVGVKGSVNLRGKGIKGQLPVAFKWVMGNFDISHNQLTTLKGCPEAIGESLDCSHNLLTSLEFMTEHISQDFDCSFNELTSLEFSSISIGGSFFCNNNKLVTLKGCPECIQRDFCCSHNPLDNFDFGPRWIKGNVV